MGPIQELAAELGTGERTLRRAVSQGTLRGRRPGPRRLRLPAGEREYLREHWPLLSGLRQVLRPQRCVRLAVLYGSIARGAEDTDSDLDLLIATDGDELAVKADLTARVRLVTDRSVDIAFLKRIEDRSPLLLDRVVHEGRVLIDRDRQWASLRTRRRAIRARARRAHGKQMAATARAIEELTQ